MVKKTVSEVMESLPTGLSETTREIVRKEAEDGRDLSTALWEAFAVGRAKWGREIRNCRSENLKEKIFGRKK